MSSLMEIRFGIARLKGHLLGKGEIMETQTTKAVATKKQAEVALSTNQTDWDLDTTDSRDMVIPKILIGQGQSPAVLEGKVRPGEIYNSVTGKVLGNSDEKNLKTAKFIAFKEETLWILQKKEQGVYKYGGQEPRTVSNENLELEFKKDGQDWRRNKALRYHVLLVDELSQPVPFPCVLTFMRTSFTAGKTLHNHFVLTKAAMQKGFKVNPADTAFELSGRKQQKDNNIYFAFDVKPTEGKTKQDHQKIAFDWLQTLKTTAYKVDETDETTEATPVDTSVNEASQF